MPAEWLHWMFLWRQWRKFRQGDDIFVSVFGERFNKNQDAPTWYLTKTIAFVGELWACHNHGWDMGIYCVSKIDRVITELVVSSSMNDPPNGMKCEFVVRRTAQFLTFPTEFRRFCRRQSQNGGHYSDNMSGVLKEMGSRTLRFFLPMTSVTYDNQSPWQLFPNYDFSAMRTLRWGFLAHKDSGADFYVQFVKHFIARHSQRNVGWTFRFKIWPMVYRCCCCTTCVQHHVELDRIITGPP